MAFGSCLDMGMMHFAVYCLLGAFKCILGVVWCLLGEVLCATVGLDQIPGGA